SGADTGRGSRARVAPEAAHDPVRRLRCGSRQRGVGSLSRRGTDSRGHRGGVRVDMTEAASNKLAVAIVDDEELARRILRELLAVHPDVEVVAECANGFEAVKAVSELSPDLLLLDVQMPKLDGFDVLELVGGEIPVIFVTAYDQHAIRAFEVHAVDYLLKPFSAERLAEALDRARARVRKRERPQVRSLMSSARPEDSTIQRILIRDRADVHVIPVEKIDYIEAQDDYIAVKSGGRSYLKEQT